MYSAPVKNFNLALKNAMFEKYDELKKIKLSENYVQSSQYALFKDEIKKQVDEKKLIEKFVTCFKNDEPATAFYTSWYDIEGPDEKQSFKSMRYFSGKLIKKEGFIGKGGQGSVFKCIWHGKPAAAKFIKYKRTDVKKFFATKGSKGEKNLKDYFTNQASEFYIGRKIDDRFVMKMYDFFLQHENGVTEFVIVSELCDKMILDEKFSLENYIQYFSQVNAAIKAMGEQGLCHRDIKPQNILLKSDENGKLSVRVADFGLSGFSGGTPLYNPPEALTKSVPFASDIYSLGITILFTLFEAELAFKLYLMPELRHDLKKKLGSHSIVAFLSRMIADDYSLRPTVDDIDHFLRTTELWKTYSSDARISAVDLGMSDELNEKTPIGSDIQRRAQKFENCPFSRLLFSETAGNSLTRVNTFQGVTDLSSMISQSIHDQGNSFKCWAFATASMIRSTLRDAVSKSKRIPELEKAAIYDSIKAINHKLLRCEIMMNVIPTKVNANSDEVQSAMLHHVMRRLTEPTFLQREGIFMLGSLRPILEKLGKFETKLEMFAHPSDYDRFPTNLRKIGVVGDFIQALELKKVLVSPVRMGDSEIKHAMCLFGINEEDEFLFKNTSNQTKTVSIPLTACEPKIGYHISFNEIQ